jgi:putative transcriptional regulator
MSEVNKEDKLHVYFGYTGWAAGQLEFELHRGDWHILTADIDGIFDKDPEVIWHEYIALVSGIWL